MPIVLKAKNFALWLLAIGGFSASTIANAGDIQVAESEFGTLNVKRIEGEFPRWNIDIDGVVLRAYREMGLVQISSQHLLQTPDQTKPESLALVHSWPGGTGCQGYLEVFSFNADGFLISKPFANCFDEFEASIIKDDRGADVLQISVSADETGENLRYIYSDGDVYLDQ
jgi:hypothetical protein